MNLSLIWLLMSFAFVNQNLSAVFQNDLLHKSAQEILTSALNLSSEDSKRKTKSVIFPYLLKQLQVLKSLKKHHVRLNRPNFDFLDQISNKLKEIKPEVLESAERLELETALAAVRPQTDKYPQPKSDLLNVSEDFSEIELDNFEADLPVVHQADHKVLENFSLANPSTENVRTGSNENTSATNSEKGKFVDRNIQNVEVLSPVNKRENGLADYEQMDPTAAINDYANEVEDLENYLLKTSLSSVDENSDRVVVDDQSRLDTFPVVDHSKNAFFDPNADVPPKSKAE